MGAALGWGALAASSLVVGALLAMLRRWPDRQIGLVLAFGAGALVSAVSYELAVEGLREGGGLPVALGIAAGALTYWFLNGIVARGDDDSGNSLALGAFLDGVPEQLVLGIGLATGDGVSIGLLVAIYVSNLPEGIGSASDMLGANRDRATVVRLWALVAVVCTLATVLGFAVADSASGELKGAINGFAAGALLVMLTDSMIPEATRKAGPRAGLVLTLGFAVAAGLSAIS
jgi:ZIP family zinc transporter